MLKLNSKIMISMAVVGITFAPMIINMAFAQNENPPLMADSAKVGNMPPSFNRPPQIDSFVVEPEMPTSATSITCIAESTADFESEPVNVIYSWLKDGKPFAALYLPFDTEIKGGANIVKDYSGNHRDCQLGLLAPYCKAGDNYPTWVGDGKIGRAMHFGGNGLPGMQNKCLNDFIAVNDSTLNFTKQFTFAMWYKADGFPGEFNFLISKEGTILLRFHPQYDYCLHGYVTSNITLENIASKKCIFNDAEIGKWHHLAFTYNGKQLALYIDGELDASKPYDKVLDVHQSAFHIGAHGAVVPAYDGTYGINGTLDEFWAFEIGLPAEQVYQLYQAGMPGHAGSTIVSQELAPGQTWTCQMTPNDGHQDGTVKETTITIGK